MSKTKIRMVKKEEEKEKKKKKKKKKEEEEEKNPLSDPADFSKLLHSSFH